MPKSDVTSIITALQGSAGDEQTIGILCAALLGITWGPDSPEMQTKRAMITKWCKMYLGERT